LPDNFQWLVIPKLLFSVDSYSQTVAYYGLSDVSEKRNN